MPDIAENYILANLAERENAQAMLEYQSSIEKALVERGMSQGQARSLIRELSSPSSKAGPAADTYRALAGSLPGEARGTLDRFIVARQRLEDSAAKSFESMSELVRQDPAGLLRASRIIDRVDHVRRDVLEALRKINPTVDIETVPGLTGGDRSKDGAAAYDPLRRVIALGLDLRSADPADAGYRGVWASLEEVLSPRERELLAARYPKLEDRAQAFADYARGLGQEDAVGKTMRDIRQFFGRVGNAARFRGFTSSEDLFDAALAGSLGERANARQGLSMAAKVGRDPEQMALWKGSLAKASGTELDLSRQATEEALRQVDRRLSGLGVRLDALFRPRQFKILTDEREQLKLGLRLIGTETKGRAAVALKEEITADAKAVKAATRVPSGEELQAAREAATEKVSSGRPINARSRATVEKYLAAAQTVEASWATMMLKVAPAGLRTEEERHDALRLALHLPEAKQFVKQREQVLRLAATIASDERMSEFARSMETTQDMTGRLDDLAAQALAEGFGAPQERPQRAAASSEKEAVAEAAPAQTAPAAVTPLRQRDQEATTLASDYARARRAAGRMWGEMMKSLGYDGPGKTEAEARERRLAASRLPDYHDYSKVRDERDRLALIIADDRPRFEPAVLAQKVLLRDLNSDIVVARNAQARGEVARAAAKDAAAKTGAAVQDGRQELDELKASLLAIGRRVNPAVEIQFADRLLMAGQAVIDSGAADGSEREVAGQFDHDRGIAAIALQPERFDARATVYHELGHSLEGALTAPARDKLEQAFPSDDRMVHKEKVAYAFQVWSLAREGRAVPEGLWREIEARAGQRLNPEMAQQPGKLATAMGADVPAAALDRGIDSAFSAMHAILEDSATLWRERSATQIDAVFEEMYSGDVGARVQPSGHYAVAAAVDIPVGRVASLGDGVTVSENGDVTVTATGIVLPAKVPMVLPAPGERFEEGTAAYHGLAGGLVGVLAKGNEQVRAERLPVLMDHAARILPQETAAGRVMVFDTMLTTGRMTAEGVSIPFRHADGVDMVPAVSLTADNPLNALYHEAAHVHLREGRISYDEVVQFNEAGFLQRVEERYGLARYREGRRPEEGLAHLAGEWGAGPDRHVVGPGDHLLVESAQSAQERRGLIAAELDLAPSTISLLDRLVGGEVGARESHLDTKLAWLAEMGVKGFDSAHIGPMPHIEPVLMARRAPAEHEFEGSPQPAAIAASAVVDRLSRQPRNDHRDGPNPLDKTPIPASSGFTGPADLGYRDNMQKKTIDPSLTGGDSPMVARREVVVERAGSADQGRVPGEGRGSFSAKHSAENRRNVIMAATAEKIYLPELDKDAARQRRADIEAGKGGAWDGSKWDTDAKKWFVPSDHKNAAKLMGQYGAKDASKAVGQDGKTKAEGRDYLYVTFAGKNAAQKTAKTAGSEIKFDRDARLWFMPDNAPAKAKEAMSNYRTDEARVAVERENTEHQARRQAIWQTAVGPDAAPKLATQMETSRAAVLSASAPQQPRAGPVAEAPNSFRLEGIDQSNKDAVKKEFPGIKWNKDDRAWEAPADHPRLNDVVDRFGTKEAKAALTGETDRTKGRVEGKTAAERDQAAKSPPKVSAAVENDGQSGEKVRLSGLDVRGMSPEQKQGLKEEYGLTWNKDDKGWDMPADHPKATEALAKYGQAPETEGQQAAVAPVVEKDKPAVAAERWVVVPNEKKANHFGVFDSERPDAHQKPSIAGFINPDSKGKHFLVAYDGKTTGAGPLAAQHGRPVDPVKPLAAQLSAAVGHEQPAPSASAEKVTGKPQLWKESYKAETQTKIADEIGSRSNEQLMADIAASRDAGKTATDEVSRKAYIAGAGKLEAEAVKRGLVQPQAAKAAAKGKDRGNEM